MALSLFFAVLVLTSVAAKSEASTSTASTPMVSEPAEEVNDEVVPRAYYIVSDKREKLGWNRANDACADMFPGGRLAEVLNRNAEDLVSQLLIAQDIESGLFWIAMNDRDKGGVATWHDGKPVDYIGLWMKGRDNNDRKRKCVLLRVKHDIIYWMWDRCGYNRNYICEYFSGPGECGEQNVSPPRIVPGQVAQLGMWPWQASLNISGEHMCGAVLLDSQWLLTAAQCVYDDENRRIIDVDSIQVRIGFSKLDEIADGELTSEVDIIETHPKYKKGFKRWDFALLHLPQPVNYTENIRPACIEPSPSGDREYDRCAISGWGYSGHPENQPSNKLKYEYVDIVDQETCDKAHFDAVYDYHVCTSNEGGVGTCYGDAGGPLVCKRNKKWFVIGISSWIRGQCASENYPSVFSRVSTAMRWISDKLKPE
ncbi:chymotrypsinogen B-like [Ptychodera flava]|uniref:chymotrypsinogen B-like n=1 Tax=Ptychodera flava TaxID=63121 RepID=UPI00396A36E8